MNQGNNILILNYKISGNHQRHLTLLQHSLNSPALLLTEVGDVLQDCYSMAVSCLFHLTNLLPGAVLVVPQDVLQIIFVIILILSSYKYIVIINIIRYNEMFNINITENVLTHQIQRYKHYKIQ